MICGAACLPASAVLPLTPKLAPTCFAVYHQFSNLVNIPYDMVLVSK
jgi:hypothetical protein